MRRIALLVLLVVVLAGCGDDAADPDAPDSIDAALAEHAPDGSSGTLVVARGKEMVACQGWGEADRDGQRAAGCDTVYDIMSMTKQFTAAAILTLWQDDRLRLDDEIGDLLPDVPADKRAITVQQLLNHAAGLPDSLGPDDEPLTRAQFLERALGAGMESEPGESYLYSNVGYSLLAVVIEEVSGQDYETYLAEHLFRPAGMTSTGYVLPEWSSKDVAVEYAADGAAQGTPLEHRWADDGPYWNLRGNGGLLSSARDMFRWHRALLGTRVLGDVAKHELFEPRVREEPDATFYADGWVVGIFGDDEPARWHNGGNGRAYGEIARDPDGRAFVFWVANQSRGSHWDLEETGLDLTEDALALVG